MFIYTAAEAQYVVSLPPGTVSGSVEIAHAILGHDHLQLPINPDTSVFLEALDNGRADLLQAVVTREM